MSNVTKLLSNFGSSASHFVIYAVMYSSTGQHSPNDGRQQMATNANQARLETLTFAELVAETKQLLAERRAQFERDYLASEVA